MANVAKATVAAIAKRVVVQSRIIEVRPLPKFVGSCAKPASTGTSLENVGRAIAAAIARPAEGIEARL